MTTYQHAAPGVAPATVLRGRHGDPLPRLQQLLAPLWAGKIAPRVLEAGCGSTARLSLPASRHLVGIDVSQRQLNNHKTLDEGILGDLQTHQWQAPGFNLIVCWDVIEHLPQPGEALARMKDALAPGGLMVLAFPNLWSLKGLVTKLTPYSVHAFFYRYVIGDKRNSDEWDQFPTFLRLAVAPPSLRAWANANQLEIAYDELYEGPVQMHLRSRGKFFAFGFTALSWISKVLSLGQLDLALSDAVLVLRKPAIPTGSGGR